MKGTLADENQQLIRDEAARLNLGMQTARFSRLVGFERPAIVGFISNGEYGFGCFSES